MISAQITAYLRIAGFVVAGFALAGVVAYWSKLRHDAAELAKVRAVDTKIEQANKRAGPQVESRKKQQADFFKRNAEETERVVKEIKDDKSNWSDRRGAEYHRVLNDALRGPQP